MEKQRRNIPGIGRLAVERRDGRILRRFHKSAPAGGEEEKGTRKKIHLLLDISDGGLVIREE